MLNSLIDFPLNFKYFSYFLTIKVFKVVAPSTSMEAAILL